MLLKILSFLVLFFVTDCAEPKANQNGLDKGMSGSQGNPSTRCVKMSGIGNSDYDFYSLSQLSLVPTSGFYLDYINFVIGTNPNFFAWETPIQSRHAVLPSAVFLHVLAAYEPAGLDLFGREEVIRKRRRCETTDLVSGNTDLFLYHRSLAWIYTVYFNVRNYYTGSARELYNAKLEGYGLDPEICDTNFVDSRCYDISTPWGLAYSATEEMYQFALNDGWNQLGDYNKRYNRVPFSDWRSDETRYVPKNNPWDVEATDSWKPLLETDHLGYVFGQQHVTPHIGYTGKSYLYSDDEFCERSKDFQTSFELNYDYEYEMGLLFERMASLTELEKMETEYFDVKPNLGTLMIQYVSALYSPSYLDTYDFMIVEMSYQLATYESILAAWKEKVDYDRIRPTSLIHHLMHDLPITTYAGVSPEGKSFGTDTYPAREFETYIRIMPHAEFPSGSACSCTAFADAMIQLFGDDVTAVLPQGLRVDFAAFSSIKEPLSTPSEDISVFYKTWSEVGKRCGETRLLGGMHFTASIAGGEQLCKNIGQRAGQTFQMLKNEHKPSWITQGIDNLQRIERKCYPDHARSSRGNK